MQHLAEVSPHSSFIILELMRGFIGRNQLRRFHFVMDIFMGI
ncbi:unknow [Vibrio parahaemolyticus]|nr:unknow [Vibrio parahaemolyticus]